jgi:hypothetical protein
MIIERKDGKVIIWTSKGSKTTARPMLHRLWFNKNTNELEFCDRKLFCSHYSIEELESMLRFLKKKNKEVVQK